jgi:hypothetical protein
MQDTVLHYRYRTNDRIKKIGMHNRSGNGYSARVAFLVFPTYTHSLIHTSKKQHTHTE